MGDRDNTPPSRPGGRPRSQWGDDQRADVGATHRRETRSYPQGVPIVAPETAVKREPVTGTFELVERELPERAKQVVNRSKRDSSDPATFGDLVNLAVELPSQGTIEGRISAVERVFRSARRLVVAGVLACAGGVSVAGHSALEKHDDAIRDDMRLRQLEKDNAKLERELAQLRELITKGH